jgi:hypothetical protein
MQDGAAIGVLAESDDGEENSLFESAEDLSHVYIVGIGG